MRKSVMTVTNHETGEVKKIDVSHDREMDRWRDKAEKTTGKRQPRMNGYCDPWRDIEDWTAFLQERFDKGLIEKRELTDEENEILSRFSSAIAAMHGNGHLFFASTHVSVEQKEAVLNMVASLANTMVIADKYAFEVGHYYPPTTPNHESVIVQSFAYLDHLLQSVADAGWDFWKSEYYFDIVQHGIKQAKDEAQMFGTAVKLGFLNFKNDLIDEMNNPGSWVEKLKNRKPADGLQTVDPSNTDAEGVNRSAFS